MDPTLLLVVFRNSSSKGTNDLGEQQGWFIGTGLEMCNL